MRLKQSNVKYFLNTEQEEAEVAEVDAEVQVAKEAVQAETGKQNKQGWKKQGWQGQEKGCGQKKQGCQDQGQAQGKGWNKNYNKQQDKGQKVQKQ